MTKYTPQRWVRLYQGKPKEKFNKAIREEVPGGSEVLEARALFSSIIRRHTGTPKEIAEIAMQRINSIRSDMIDHLKDKYDLP